MDMLEKQGFVVATVFTLANKLQVIGDSLDEKTTIKQWLFLIAVTQFVVPPTVSEVAHFLGYSRQNAKRMAALLEERGFVRIFPDASDGRALRISVTPRCLEYFAQRKQKEIDSLSEVFAGFDDQLIDGLYRGVARLSENVGLMMEKPTSVQEE